jgi:hypothetical protein
MICLPSIYRYLVAGRIGTGGREAVLARVRYRSVRVRESGRCSRNGFKRSKLGDTDSGLGRTRGTRGDLGSLWPLLAALPSQVIDGLIQSLPAPGDRAVPTLQTKDRSRCAERPGLGEASGELVSHGVPTPARR